MDVTTDSLRALAPKWSLAGDNRLLTLLQNTHQKIVTKCREVNTKLDEMASALDVASINLQNVNNKFMALSNSQFIESRVYDDDGDVADVKQSEEASVPEMIDEISLLKRGLAILDNAHETAEIVDYSDSDSDAEISVVLKPKDLYSHRPLPYTIGSQPWRNKWHSGLVVEDSDSDNSCSDVREVEQYSASEDEHTNRPVHDQTISETSSFSDRDISRDRDTVSKDRELSRDISRNTDIPKKQTPADIAAELAARLGQAPPRILEEPEEYRQPTNKSVYRPQNPVTSTIFSDEPPPMDNIHSESHDDDDDDDDIFAEINKKQPYNNSNKDYVDDLFGKPVEGYNKEQTKSANQKSTLFYDESEPELFADNLQINTKGTGQNKVAENEENTVKKPVGGISLFGSNKGTESIGAAILSRNRRKSSSSGNESDAIKTVAADKSNSSEDSVKNNANAIFDNLFAKAKQAEQKTAKQDLEKKTPVKPNHNVKDLFSDNIFDDIDDIFTSNIKIPTKDAYKNAKSIFDDGDDDDLFSDIPKSNAKTTAASSRSNNMSIFDSDDELFSDVKSTKITGNVTENSSIDSFTEKVKESQDKNGKEYNNNTTESAKAKGSAGFDNLPTKGKEKPKPKSKSIFDSDSDDDDIFSNIKINSNKNKKSQELNQNINTDHKTETEFIKDYKPTTIVDNLKAEKSKVFQSPSIFEEDEIDDLFMNANKTKIPESVTSINTLFSEKTGDDIEFQNNEEVLTKNDVNKKENKSETCTEDIRKIIDIKKPVIVDTKPYLFPKIDEPCKSNDEDLDKNNIFVGSKIKETDVINCLGDVEDIIETSQNTESVIVQSKSSSLSVGIVSNIPNLDFDDKNKTEYDNTATKQQRLYNVNEELIQGNELDVNVEDKGKQDTVIENNAIPAAFDDIFSEPPAFEKIKETKKSTNVNALFEDDSDDEALFFKKNDVISDEKPVLFSSSANFAIFNDEPPALDDFKTQIHKFDNDNDRFTSVRNEESIIIANEPVIDDWDDSTPLPNHIKPRENTCDIKSNIFSSQVTPTSETKDDKLKTKIASREVPDSDDELFSYVPKTSQKDETIKEFNKSGEINDTKKTIGKLDTKNLNINVQALVPGASPKKTLKAVTESYKDTKVIESVTEVDNAESKIVKSISFEDKPDSGVLDNNLSKQRPRIQVKRRPSSRKARHEAVRKSVLVVDDDTDNSSSFDECRPQPGPNIILDKELNNETIQNQVVIKEKTIGKAETSSIFQNVPINEEHDVFKSGVIDRNEEILINPNENINKNLAKLSFDETDAVTRSVDKTAIEINRAKSPIVDKSQNEKRKESKEAKTPESTTKVVYILNDEDIFSQEKPKENLIGKDDLLRNKEIDENLFKNMGITTIGTTYKETTKAQPIQTESSIKAQAKAKSLFELSDDDDDDFFGKNKKAVKIETKSKLFESDSEDDLFSGKKDKVKQKVKNKDVKKKEIVAEVKKVSLFGDDDDDDDEDLFGVKTKTVTDQNKPASSKTVSKEAAQSTEIVFEDPLSMLE